MSSIDLRLLAAGFPALLVSVGYTCDANAGYGVYLHNYGVQSGGSGGAGYSLVQDTTPLSANPALAAWLGSRIDLIVEFVGPMSSVSIRDNAYGPDMTYRSSETRYWVPQAGWALQLDHGLAVGMTGFAAGVGAAYEGNPYERIGADRKVSVSFGQFGLSSVIAWKPVQDQALGLSINLSYQLFELQGLEIFAPFSENSNRVSDQGNDGAPGIGATLGWYGRLTPSLSAGAGYRTKTWTRRLKRYSGLFPDQGSMELPATFGGGLAWDFSPRGTLGLEVQRVMYGSESALGNRFSNLQSHQLGADEGPGFGWRNQTIYKLGMVWQYTESVTLRAGYSRASQQIRSSETLLNALVPNTSTEHLTLGASWYRP